MTKKPDLRVLPSEFVPPDLEAPTESELDNINPPMWWLAAFEHWNTFRMAMWAANEPEA